MGISYKRSVRLVVFALDRELVVASGKLQSGSLWNEGLLPILSIQAVRCYAEIAAFVVVTTLHQRRALLGDQRLESLKPASDIPNKSFATLCIAHDLDKHKRDKAISAYTMECYHAVVLQKNVDSSEL